MKTLIKAFTAVAILGAGLSTAVAGDTTWQFNKNLTADYRGYGNTLTSTAVDGSQSATITAWTGTDNGTIKDSEAWANNYGLLAYSQFGEKNKYGKLVRDSHYVDNSRGSDMLLFSFEDAVSLTSIKLGSAGGDSDISIAAFSELPALNGSSWASIASQAIFKTNLSNIGTTVTSIAQSAEEAKYWLIGAYNTAFGETWTTGNDAFKLLALTTHSAETTQPPVDVPAPGTAMLLTLGVGLIALRRRQK